MQQILTRHALVSNDDDDEDDDDRQFMLFVWNLLPLEVLKRQANAGITSLSSFILVTTSLSSSSLKSTQQSTNNQMPSSSSLIQHQQQAGKISAVRFDKRRANETTRDESNDASSDADYDDA